MNRNQSPISFSSDISDIQLESIRNIRSKLANAAIISSSIIAFFAVAASISRALIVGWQDAAFLSTVIFVAALGLLVFHRRLSYSTRAFIIPGILFICGLAGLFRFGLIGMGIPCLITCCILATIFFGNRFGFIVLTANLGAIAIVGAGTKRSHSITAISTANEMARSTRWEIHMLSGRNSRGR